MNCFLAYTIALISGGLAGAIFTRYFALMDRRLQKLTLRAVKEEVKSIIQVTINQTNYSNLTYKEFILENKTDHDYSNFDIIFEFDKESTIISEETDSQLGKNKCAKTRPKASECIYHITNFNRKQTITFKFEVAGITNNFFSAVLDKTGVDFDIIQSNVIEKPRMSPSKFVSKSTIEQ